jgi:DNA (cytosine-5)-methyltransferase 1
MAGGAVLRLKRFGVPEHGGMDEFDLDSCPCPTITANGLSRVGHSQYHVQEMIVIRSQNKNGWISGRPFPVDEPSPTLMAHGMAGDHWRSMNLEDDGMPEELQDQGQPGKPPYRVPTMQEVAAIPWNGLTVASTFSGGGGSCTGYRMAGYRVAWASEFVPAAQESYKANAAPGSILDGRDVRTVQPQEVLDALGIQKGDLDLLDGSPPCQAFSTAGKRHKGWGKDKTYEHGAKQKNEDLFQDYVRLLRGLMPRTFVAENVSGLVKGVAKGYFIEILRALKDSGYRVECRVLDAQWLGVPQCRQRTIFVGVREDLCAAHGVGPVHPKPLPWRYSVREACPWIGRAVHDTSGRMGAGVNSYSAGEVTDRPCPAVTIGVAGLNTRHFAVEEAKPTLKMGAHGFFPGREIDLTREPAPSVAATGLGSYDYELENAAGNDLAVPHVAGPETDISRYAIGDEWDKLKPGEQSKKYFNLIKPSPDQPSPSIMASSGAFPSAAQPLHPTEKRKFTIAELRRIGSFPDDYVLCGSYADQWARIGNSVPPVMAFHVGRAIRDQVLFKVDGREPWQHDPQCLIQQPASAPGG